MAGQAGLAVESILLGEKIAERREAERRLATELDVATKVQSELFPQDTPALETLDYCGRCIQARAIGGDYYDFVPLSGDRLGLLLADICGKGIGAALLMANLQAHLRGETSGTVTAREDGTFLVLRGDTPWETASAVAALLRRWGSDAAIVRGGDPAPLEAALAAQGIPGLGLSSTSRWRPALQVLPLALELAFAPKDPHRVLELLTLPAGPFQGRVGRKLAEAISRSPGVGGLEWQRTKEELAQAKYRVIQSRARAAGEDDLFAHRRAAEEAHLRLAEIAAWLEDEAHDPALGAPRAALLAVVKRVKDIIEGVYDAGESSQQLKAAQARETYRGMDEKAITREIKRVEKEMLEAARRLEFERAAELRNRPRQLKARLFSES